MKHDDDTHVLSALWKNGQRVETEALHEEIAKSQGAIALKKFLVPTDFSGRAEKALQYALSFADPFGATIHLLHVVSVVHGGAIPGEDRLPAYEKECAVRGNRELARLAETHRRRGVSIETHTLSGAPVREIVRFVREFEIDLLILSTHGRPELKHWLLGSTAENLVRHVSCPVLVVRPHEHEFISPLEPQSLKSQ